MTGAYPQVVLFGSIYGGWREDHIIPVLDKLGVTYYNPIGDVWTKEMGDREADVMAHCETIVIVINTLRPSFAGLAETGWAALGAAVRGQHLILQIDEDMTIDFPDFIRQTEEGAEIARNMQEWATRSRYLVLRHAHYFDVDRIHLVDDLDGVIAALRAIYG